MQNFRNYYEILGVSREATQDDIKRAYRQLARRYHPDMNPGDKNAEEQFKRLGEAYAVLYDPDKRSKYEEFSQFWKQKGFQSVRFKKRSQADIDFAAFQDFDKFVDQILNRHRSENRRETPNSTRSKSSQRPQSRQPSKTTASSPPKQAASSPRSNRRDAEANLTLPLEKAYAGGRERIRLEDGRSLEVNMPMGMVTGQRIRLKGQGIGGGNLYLRIEVEPHAFFKLRSNDVFCRVPITPSEAALGGSIQVPTLDGPTNLTLPAGVQTGQQLRLAGKGYPIGQERRGDQIVEIQVVIPSTLSDRETALYTELRGMESFAPRANLPV